MGRQESKSRNQKESQNLHENEKKQKRKSDKKIRLDASQKHRSWKPTTIIEVGDSPKMRNPKWDFIISLRKDNTWISPLKDKGRRFNNPKDKGNILNRRYVSVHTSLWRPRPSAHSFRHVLPDMGVIQVTEEEGKQSDLALCLSALGPNYIYVCKGT